MSLTPTQQRAVQARGNVLVMAGAGTGKTSTLIERCLGCLMNESPPASLEEILIVTFTEAAAAEMRQRLRIRLEQQSQQGPARARWQEQLALFETAQIGTLHSFCFRLVRQHFYELELDPQLSVLTDEETRLLANETLDELLKEHYAGHTTDAEAVQRLIQTQAGGWDEPIRKLILRLHQYTQTLPDPEAWFRQQLDAFAAAEPVQWRQWLLQALVDWRQRWIDLIASEAAKGNQVALTAAAALDWCGQKPERSQAARALAQIAESAARAPYGSKTAWTEPLEEFLKETDFLRSLATVADADPLAEDWQWSRGQMTTLLQLARQFEAAFSETKREQAVLDFHDLEQYALRLLWDRVTDRPSPIASEWRQKLRYVFVDEYQDINAAQDRIIQALSRPDTQANRFLVGDVKQSIYRFRLANPAIFQNYVRCWKDGPGQAIALTENFRSRHDILKFVNGLFTRLMRTEVGGVAYDDDAQLRLGQKPSPPPPPPATDLHPPVELHLRLRQRAREDAEPDEEADKDAAAELANLAESDKEARLLAIRLRELHRQQLPVWDESAQAWRPVEWSDMAILLRSPSGKAEAYAKEFSRLNIPLQVERGGFFSSIEIADLLSLLKVLDNPLQDVPVLAVLRSPLVGLSLDELATIRLQEKGPFWGALLKWHTAQPKPDDADSGPSPTTLRKVSIFLERFGRWRRMARRVSLSRCLDVILAETHYAAWLLTQPRGEQRQNNVRRLLSLALRFDQFQRQGLFRFLAFIEAQRDAEAEPDVAAALDENAVRLMSIHQSKGLEFPLVVVADLGKPFNTSDLKSDLILDEQFGLCPQIRSPESGKRYPSLPFWLAGQRQHREMLGEELRLLYVACTRAKERLLLSGTVAENRFEKIWKLDQAPTTRNLLGARSFSDWLGGWFAARFGTPILGATQGQDDQVHWQIHDDEELFDVKAEPLPKPTADDLNAALDPAPWNQLEQRLSWNYPFARATREPAKTSVTLLRSQATVDENQWAAPVRRRGSAARQPTAPAVAAVDFGSAQHAFLRWVSLDAVGTLEDLKTEAERLVSRRMITAEAAALVDFNALAAFWQSDLGVQVRAQRQCIQRELPFTARFSLAELAAITGEPAPASTTGQAANVAGEFVVVQGVADLAVILPSELWLLDFKTDQAGATNAKDYELQLRLYGRALSRIYRRPTTHCWIYFLSTQQAVAVADAANQGIP